MGRQSLTSSISFDRGSDRLVHGGNSRPAIDANNALESQPSSDPFDVAQSASKKGMMFTEVKELIDDEESAKGTSKLKMSKGVEGLQHPIDEIPSLKDAPPSAAEAGDGEWDDFSELGKGDEDDQRSNHSNEFGGLSGLNNANLLGAIKEAKGQTMEQIDDEFEIDPDLNDRLKEKNKKGGLNNRDNLRQGVSTGFNFKEILNSGKPCSEDELEDMMESDRDDGNPLELSAGKQKTSELISLWEDRRRGGSKAIVDNVERLVERLIMREAEKLIDQNGIVEQQPNSRMKSSIPKGGSSKFMKNEVIEGLDEIEDLDELDLGGQGFQFYGGGAAAKRQQPKAGPTLAPVSAAGFPAKQSPLGGFGQKKHSPPALALGGPEKVTPITSMAIGATSGNHGRKSSSYGKKIGFDDDFDDDWDDTDRNKL